MKTLLKILLAFVGILLLLVLFLAASILYDTITGRGRIEHVAGLPSLRSLSLKDSLISNAGLAHVSGLRRLESFLSS